MVGGTGLWVLYAFVNPLTMWLTLATFVGYAIVYTVLLKPATPQNIVIGGASGAMPPVLGWAAVTNDVAPEALLLFLIIFVWTPPHFWSLALYRTQDYAKAGLPMLPVTHGPRYTRLHDRALHGRAGRGDAAAVRDPDERLPLSRRGARRWAGCSCSTRCSSTATTAIELARATFKYSIIYLAALFIGAPGRPLSLTTRGACAAAQSCGSNHDRLPSPLAPRRRLRARRGVRAGCAEVHGSDVTGTTFGTRLRADRP